MFQYILQGRYVLTIVLVASIVGYIVFYTLERISHKRALKKEQSRDSRTEGEEDDEDTYLYEESSSVLRIEDEDGNELMVFEEDSSIISDDEDDDSSDDDEELLFIEEDEDSEDDGDGEDDDDDDDSSDDDEVIVAHPEENLEADEDQEKPKKHKVKNIAEGVSRDDILQDKHEKNLKKIKYEALLFKQRNDMAGFEKKLIEGLILDPDDIDIYRQLGDFYFSEGKYTKALSMFRKMLSFDGDDHHALWQIGEIYIEQGQFEDAQVFIEKALSLSPDNPKYYISLIDICIAKEEFQTALGHLEKIVALRPRNISYLMALGEMYEKLGRKDDAKETYSRVLEIDPLHIDVKHILKRF